MMRCLCALLILGLASCASQKPVAVARPAGTHTLDERTGLVVDDQGRAVSAETLRAQQRQALATAPAPAKKGKGFWAEWYSVENIQKRMAIGAQVGAAAQRTYLDTHRTLNAARVPAASPTPAFRRTREPAASSLLSQRQPMPPPVQQQPSREIYYHSDGTNTQRIGNIYHHSNGASTQKVGDIYYHSNGTTTQRVGW